MKMRRRKKELYMRQLLALKIEELIAELEQAANALMEALEDEKAARAKE